jgi:phage tail P2-like protein
MNASIQPVNLSPISRALERLMAEVFREIYDISSLWDIDRVEPQYLPYLAWSLGVELWPDDELVSTDEKRALVKRYILIRRLKGTRRALELAYEAIGVRAEIEERAGGEPYKLKILFFSREKIITPRLYEAIVRLTRDLIPLRVELDLQIVTSIEGRLVAAGRLSATPIVRLSGGD